MEAECSLGRVNTLAKNTMLTLLLLCFRAFGCHHHMKTSCVFVLFFVMLKSKATAGVYWVEFFPSVKQKISPEPPLT